MTSTVGFSRDLRIDFLRGIALLVIFSDHIGGNIVAKYTPVAFGLSDMSDVFVFLSGYSCGLSYGGRMKSFGFLSCLKKASLRAGQLYVVKVLVTAFSVALILAMSGWVEPHFFGLRWSPELAAASPFETILEIELFRLELFQYFILALYIPLLLVLPYVLIGMVYFPRFTFAASALIYVAVQFFPTSIALPAPWSRAMYFNPFAWQFLFFSAVSCSQMNPKSRQKAFSLFPPLPIAIAVLTAAVFVHFQWGIPKGWWSDKPNWGPIRMVHFAFVLICAIRMTPASRVLSGIPLLRPILICGRYPLVAYCSGGLLGILGEAVLNVISSKWPLQIAVNVVGWGCCLAATSLWKKIRVNRSMNSAS